jgi:hypothetical protein
VDQAPPCGRHRPANAALSGRDQAHEASAVEPAHAAAHVLDHLLEADSEHCLAKTSIAGQLEPMDLRERADHPFPDRRAGSRRLRERHSRTPAQEHDGDRNPVGLAHRAESLRHDLHSVLSNHRQRVDLAPSAVALVEPAHLRRELVPAHRSSPEDDPVVAARGLLDLPPVGLAASEPVAEGASDNGGELVR